MQIQIESTDQLTEINGVPVRAWKGLTASGVECVVFVATISVRDELDHSEFNALIEQQPCRSLNSLNLVAERIETGSVPTPSQPGETSEVAVDPSSAAKQADPV